MTVFLPIPLPCRRLVGLGLLITAAALLTQTAQAEADIAAGEALFKRVCGNCHNVGPGARAAFGPQLNGIFGRHAGATRDYRYSPAMQQADLVWDRDTLSAFIKDSDSVVPGNKMRFWGIGDQQKIDSLLLYLKAQQDH
ncbi:c-type cytochrome [Pseudomonas sp. G34]|uniref:c-type cytochrome n=1 Tax=Pseudomonas sp. G34 TaxID=3059083 RepID=UPI002809804D|nr:c-type cytochrome [Pseudomonas sp. G34]MDQ7985929.1 c-type cytochrome [Pseudomonas sp. G34]